MTDIMPDGVIRSCVVTHKVRGFEKEKKAIFHRWVQSVLVKEDTQIVSMLALVEYADGSVAQVSVKNIRFTDNLFDAYFKEEEDGEEDPEESIPVQ